MRGRSKMKQMKLGQTIVAEREQAVTESERMQARKKVRRKHTMSVVMVLLVLAVGVLAIFLGMKEWATEDLGTPETPSENLQVSAEIVDEDNRGQISERVRTYIAQLEQDFRDIGYRVTRVTLPTGTSRELYVDLDGQEMYFKINMDRGSAVSAEDAERMIRYLKERDLHPEYVDVRVEGKAYYK